MIAEQGRFIMDPMKKIESELSKFAWGAEYDESCDDEREKKVEVTSVCRENPITWASNTARWLYSAKKTGGIDFFVDHFVDKETGRVSPCKRLTMAHVVGIGFAHPECWRVFNQCKGERVRGGDELDLVGEVITSETPLTINEDARHQRKIKTLCTRHLFSPQMAVHLFPYLFQQANEMLNAYIDHTNPCVNFSDVIIKLLPRLNAVMFGPPGSRAHGPISQLLQDPKWDDVPIAVKKVGEHVNEAVLLSPTYLLVKGLETCTHLVKRTGIVHEESLPEAEYKRYMGLLIKATGWVIDASQEALSIDIEPEMVGGKPMKGMIEVMLEKEDAYTSEQIAGMIRLILFVGQRTTTVTLEAAVRCLALYPEWQTKIYEEIQEKIPHGKPTHEEMMGLKSLRMFILEVLRLYPAVLIQTRDTIQPITVGLKYDGPRLASATLIKKHDLNDFDEVIEIPKGTKTAYAHYLAQRNPEIFTEPNEFEPTRWRDVKGKQWEKMMHPFSGSPSKCCGAPWAHEGTIPAVLIALILNYRFKPKNVEEMTGTKIKGGAIATTDRPVEIVVSHRGCSQEGRKASTDNESGSKSPQSSS